MSKRKVIVPIIMLLICYILVSFIEMDININNWSKPERVLTSIVYGILLIINWLER